MKIKERVNSKLLAVEWNKRLSATEYTQRRVPFGKYAGKMIKDVPTTYLTWAVLNLETDYWTEFFARELQRRKVV